MANPREMDTIVVILSRTSKILRDSSKIKAIQPDIWEKDTTAVENLTKIHDSCGEIN